jgi:hypothetical protein
MLGGGGVFSVMPKTALRIKKSFQLLVVETV